MNNIISIGITGHRVYPNQVQIEGLVRNEVKNLNSRHNIVNVVSPLAEGADRMVARVVLELTDDIRLIAPIPFAVDEYKKDFQTESSREEFDSLLAKSHLILLNDFISPKNEPIYDENRNLLYKNVGKYVVDHCDVLFAIWDGNTANGVGGTADIVEYAIKQSVEVIHFDVNSLKVKRLGE